MLREHDAATAAISRHGAAFIVIAASRSIVSDGTIQTQTAERRRSDHERHLAIGPNSPAELLCHVTVAATEASPSYPSVSIDKQQRLHAFTTRQLSEATSSAFDVIPAHPPTGFHIPRVRLANTISPAIAVLCMIPEKSSYWLKRERLSLDRHKSRNAAYPSRRSFLLQRSRDLLQRQRSRLRQRFT